MNRREGWLAALRRLSARQWGRRLHSPIFSISGRSGRQAGGGMRPRPSPNQEGQALRASALWPTGEGCSVLATGCKISGHLLFESSATIDGQLDGEISAKMCWQRALGVRIPARRHAP